MEDFGSIVGTLLFIGAAIYSFVAKAREVKGGKTAQREEQGEATGEHSQPAEESDIEKALRQLFGEEAIPRQTVAPKRVMAAECEDESPEDEVFTYDRQATTPQDIFSYDREGVDEAQREAFSYETTAEKPREVLTASDREAIVAAKAVTFTKIASQNITTEEDEEITGYNYDDHKSEVEEVTTEDHAAEDATGANNALHNVLGEDFNLRRAVIYSELLRPKFEE